MSYKTTLKHQLQTQQINEWLENHGSTMSVKDATNGGGCTVYGTQVEWESDYPLRSNEGTVRKKVYVLHKHNSTTTHLQFGSQCPLSAYLINQQSQSIIQKIWEDVEDHLGYKIDNQVKDDAVNFSFNECHGHATLLKLQIQRLKFGIDPKDDNKAIELGAVLLSSAKKIIESLEHPVVHIDRGFRMIKAII